MRNLRKASAAFLVWATAASALLGSTPHVVCRCPNGQIKLFCVSMFLTSSKSCCCNGSCCQSKAKSGCCCKSGPAKKTGCGGETKSEKNPPLKGDAGADGAFSSSSCQKTFVKTNAPVLTRAETKSFDSGSSSLVLLATAELGCFIKPAPLRKIWRVAWPPPPTDLVTSLKRLTI
jgi:hypothetical protein